MRSDVEVECAHCGKKFERKAWEVEQRQRQGWALYCSTTCRDTARRGRKGEQRVERLIKTCPQCGKEFGADRQPNEVRRQKYCSTVCSGKAGGRKPRPDGVRYITRDGYVTVYVPPEERPEGQERRVYFQEHRLVMSRVLGRWPGPHESVHHINGDKTDNRLENLQLRNGSHGKGHVLRCRSCGSRDIEYVEL